MSMAQDIAEIKWMLGRMGDPDKLTKSLDNIHDKLRHDIEPKLEAVIENQIAQKPPADLAKPQLSPDDMLRAIRYAIIYATSERKLEAIKELRKITNAGLAEAKATAEWIEQRMKGMAEQIAKKEAE